MHNKNFKTDKALPITIFTQKHHIVFKKKPKESLQNSPLLTCKHIFPIFIKLPSFRTGWGRCNRLWSWLSDILFELPPWLLQLVIWWQGNFQNLKWLPSQCLSSRLLFPREAHTGGIKPLNVSRDYAFPPLTLFDRR